jgi:hypothetical protein
MSHSKVRPLVLIAAGISKLIFIALVLSEGSRYLGGAGIAIGVDAGMILLFGWYLMAARRDPVVARKVEGVGV